jgi:GH24 family phage-related lysozyme (muramidase)
MAQTELQRNLRTSLETKLGRVQQVTDTGTVDPSIRNQQLLKGLSELSTSLASFAKSGQQRKVQNDIITARTAFAVNKEMPGGLAPEAELAYDTLVAKKNTNQFFRILQDDADVFGNGVLTDDENYPDHNEKQLAFEDYIDGSVQTFFSQAQFTEAQQGAILETITLNKDKLKSNFTTLAAKDIKAQKLNDTAEYVQESVLSNIETFKFIRGVDPANADSTINEYFTDQWHTDLQKEILEANPHLSKDEADLTIIEQLSLIATDPDNPQPDLLNYLDDKRAGGKPRFTSIKGLRDKIRTAQRTAESAFITKFNADYNLEQRQQKENEELAGEGAMQKAVKVASTVTDFDKLSLELKAEFPDLTTKELRATVNFALKLKTNAPGDPKITARLIQEASMGRQTNVSLEADPRTKFLNRQQLLQVYGEVSKFRMGQVTRNRNRINEEIDDFKFKLEKHLSDDIKGTIILPNGKSYVPSGLTSGVWDAATGRYLGFDAETDSIIDNLVSQYETSVYNVLNDPDNMDINDLQQELLKNKENLFKQLGMLKGELRPVEAGQPKSFDFEKAFDAEVATEPPSSPEEITKSQAPVPTVFEPKKHIPPPAPKEQLKITESVKQNTSWYTNLINEAKELIKGDQDVRSSDIKKKPTELNRAQEKTKAFEQAMPDKPNERSDLRNLQDDAEFQSDRDLTDLISEFFTPKEAGAATFITEQEGFLLEAKDIGDGKITSGIGLTDTGRKLGDKVSKEEAVKELKERMNRVELPALEKLKPVIPFKLTENQETVLLSLMFNIGVQALRTSDAMKHLKANRMEDFKREAFSKEEGWVKSAGKFSQGLFNRRQRELQLWDK